MKQNNKSETSFNSTVASIESSNKLEMFTEIEAAKLLRIARITLQRIRFRGEIEFTRIGSKVIYTRNQIESFVTGNTVRV